MHLGQGVIHLQGTSPVSSHPAQPEALQERPMDVLFGRRWAIYFNVRQAWRLALVAVVKAWQ